ncbi:Uncharacterised protein [Serratia proteamaculans]|uniref:hypothetical protein n=1 Tax=Serratia proteamaculans TaxID=28151 RepID=UPI00217B87ED|nr:hypothetical protein [Serratia proteamaculans]CAI1019331.1 Uncharacterised protein [Serratia proteamaculans]
MLVLSLAVLFVDGDRVLQRAGINPGGAQWIAGYAAGGGIVWLGRCGCLDDRLQFDRRLAGMLTFTERVTNSV